MDKNTDLIFAKLRSDFVFEIVFAAIDHHHNGIGFVVADLFLDAKIVASSNINNGGRFAGSKFCNDLVLFASDLVSSCLDSDNRVTVESSCAFSDLHSVEIAVFDPGGANLITTVHHFHGFRSAIVVFISSFSEESVIDPVDLSLGFIRIQRRSSFVFDPGGNHIRPLLESPQPPWTSIFSPEPPWDMLHHGHRPYDPGGFDSTSRSLYRNFSKLLSHSDAFGRQFDLMLLSHGVKITY